MSIQPQDGSVAGRRISNQWDRRHQDDTVLLAYALETGLTGTSPVVDRYERLLSARYEIEHALAVSSGAAALTVALSSLDGAEGGDVILPPSCPICTVFPVQSFGLRPVFCDVMPNSFGLDAERVAAAITPDTRAIIEVPMWGYPTPVDRLQVAAATCGIPLILDLAHSHMVTLHGRPLAHYGDVACFSTHESKFLSTGEGGFVLTKDTRRNAKMRAYSRFGNLAGETCGLNYKLGGLQAAVGAARLGSVDQLVAVGLNHREDILRRLHNPHVRELPVADGGTVSGYAMLLQTVDSDGRRLVEYLERNGIPSDITKYDNRPLYEYPILGAYRSDCPNATALLRSLTTIPLHQDLTDNDLAHIVKTVNAYAPVNDRLAESDRGGCGIAGDVPRGRGRDCSGGR